MRAIILAAGIGRRLSGDSGEQPPKCLLRFGGATLLQRQLDALTLCGVTDVAIVLGYRAESIEDELDASDGGPRPATLLNPEYRQGSVGSLWTAREALRGGGDVLVLDADVLFHPEILRRLITTPDRNSFLLDRDFEAGDEPVKLCIADGVPVEFRKRVAPELAYEFAGESVGFMRFAEDVAAELAARTEAYVNGGRIGEPHEEAVRDVLLADPTRFAFQDVTGLPWIEIDFPEDVQRAERDVLPRLSEACAGGPRR